MPSSKPSLIPDVVWAVIDCKPTSILDCGVGFGKYGLLFREYLEACHGRYGRNEWAVRIDCVEIFEKYITDLHRYIYNNIYLADLVTFEPEVKYDVIYCGDVIEHIGKSEALRLLQRLKQYCNHLVIAIPLGEQPQGEWYGNKHERHLSTWQASDFMNYETKIIKDSKGVFVWHK